MWEVLGSISSSPSPEKKDHELYRMEEYFMARNTYLLNNSSAWESHLLQRHA
jgi:hypothetical protein